MVKINASTQKVGFEVKLPDAKNVALVGDFNGWNSELHALQKQKGGTWKTEIEIPEGSYYFRYLVNHKDWVNDEKLPAVPNEFGTENSVLVVKFSKS